MQRAVALALLLSVELATSCDVARMGVAAPAPAAPRVIAPTPLAPLAMAASVESLDLPDPAASSEPAAGDDTCLVRDDLDVLFIGNSYTIAHDLHLQVAQLAHEAGLTMRVQRLALPGKTLEFHARRAKVKAALASRDWDFVVLQGQSLEPLRDPDEFMESGATLAQMVWDSGATPVFFETWPRKEGHPVYVRRPRVSGGSPAAMQHALHEAYAKLAAETNAEIVPAGEAWMAVTAAAPNVNLYDTDLHHPGKRGTYLNANLLFAQLTNVSPVGNVGAPLRRVEPEVAAMLQAQAAAVIHPVCAHVPHA